jgi:hypothetical protein
MMPHTKPDEEFIKKNAAREPEGERIRAELIDFLERNKIVSICLDTQLHTVQIDSGKLPPKIKSVLTKWGSIYVVDDSPNVDLWASYVEPTRPEGWDDNMVPPMTHPYGRHWPQPALSEIVIDDKTARMSKAAFDELLEYSATNPSGAYEGKMWRRHVARGGVPTWQLCWFGYSTQGKGWVANLCRTIVLTDGELPK